ncbi:hypothetical protein T02_6741, partial [Trichinella nativa]
MDGRFLQFLGSVLFWKTWRQTDDPLKNRPLHVLSQLSSLMDRNEGNNACLLHLNRCKQDTPVSKNRTEFSQLQLPANTRS